MRGAGGASGSGQPTPGRGGGDGRAARPPLAPRGVRSSALRCVPVPNSWVQATEGRTSLGTVVRALAQHGVFPTVSLWDAIPRGHFLVNGGPGSVGKARPGPLEPPTVKSLPRNGASPDL